ncbi:MAG: murein biosynthesis integral membrane protein MurJ [Anaeromyxobacteraceae bacterium]
MAGAPPGDGTVKVGRAIWLSAATMSSRVLGLLRDQLFAALFGAGHLTDAFVVAFRIPNILRDLFAEGALSSAFVPTFADVRRNQGDGAAHRLADVMTALVCLVLGTLVLLGVLFADGLVAALAPGLTAPDLATRLARIMMPFLLLVSLAALAMGILNAQGRFTAPALASTMFNAGSIAAGVVIWQLGWPPERALTGWAVGTMIGGLLQLVIQLPSLQAQGYIPRPRLAPRDLGDPSVRRIGRLMAAAVVGLSATQVNVLVSTWFVSHQEGGATWLSNAFRLMQLPLGVFGVAIATVAGAGIAQRVAARDHAAVREMAGSAMRLVAFLNVPSAVGLAVLALPIISMIYEHGRFGPDAARGTAEALVFYAGGLYAYSGVKVLAPAFYALDRPRIPVAGSVAGMLANVVLCAGLWPVLGHRGVALGTSAAAWVNYLVLAWSFQRVQGSFGGPSLVRQLGRVLLASAPLAAASWATLEGVARGCLAAGIHGVPRQLLVGLLPVLAGVLTYLGAAKALGLPELEELLGALRRRRARRA